MKESSSLDLLESQNQPFHNHQLSQDFFEEQKIAYPFEEHLSKDLDQENIIKTPRSKKMKKLVMKNNPQDTNSASKSIKQKQKKYKCMSQERQKNPNQLFGHWSVQQNKRYHWFLEIHHTHFMNRSLRRMDRIFTSMAKFVGTREAQQCRSHHQKMQKKHKIFPKILLSLRSSYYGTCSVSYLREDVDQNKIPIIDPLLTEQFLLENLSFKQIPHDDGNSRGEDEDSQEEKKERKSEGKVKVKVETQVVDMIDEIIVPDIESSKNYFKMMTQNHERNNILDDGYESNLPFGCLF